MGLQKLLWQAFHALPCETLAGLPISAKALSDPSIMRQSPRSFCGSGRIRSCGPPCIR
jgi:hypothetical protein